MQCQSCKVFFRFAPVFYLIAVIAAAPGWAQFEVSPDHFDLNSSSGTKKPVIAQLSEKKGVNTISAGAGDKNRKQSVVYARKAEDKGKTRAQGNTDGSRVQSRASSVHSAVQVQGPVKRKKEPTGEPTAFARSQ